VGDELQSIYAFRHAEVQLFRDRRERLEARGGALTLVHNFRSRPPLIAAVNHVFATRFKGAYTPLVAARREADQPGGDAGAAPGRIGTASEPLVELLLTDRRGWQESPHAAWIGGELPNAPIWRHAEARMLAQRVAELVAGGAARAG